MHYKSSFLVLALAGLIGCSSNKAPEVSGNIRNSLHQAGLTDVSVSQDRTRGVVTLGGHVAQEADKVRAEEIAKSMAGGQVVADEIAVRPIGQESEAKRIGADVDKSIDKNVDAALTQAGLQKVRHETKNGVVTLKGAIDTTAHREQAEHIVAAVPNVQQVVNEIGVGRHAKERATSAAPTGAPATAPTAPATAPTGGAEREK